MAIVQILKRYGFFTVLPLGVTLYAKARRRAASQQLEPPD
jgi:hypothetical protein